MAGSSSRPTTKGPSHIGGTLGQRLVNTNRSQLALPAGLLVNDEQGVDIFLAVNVFDTFDSEPPSADAHSNDVGVVLSFGLTF